MRTSPLLALLPILALTGCVGFSTTATPADIANPSATIHGRARGGQQPISDAQIYLFQVGTSGYGSASTSLINPHAPGVTPGASGAPSYVTTDSTGSFTFDSSAYTCVNGNNLTYIVALGGNPGLAPGTFNAGTTFLAALGPCSGLADLNSVVISELSTVAAVTALQQFVAGPFSIGAPASNAIGIQNAFLNIHNLADVDGANSARAKPVKGSGTSPQGLVNTLADILAPCVNSDSPSSGTCTALFSAATPPGATSPTDVFAAMLLIARNPSNNVTRLTQLITAQPPFRPTFAGTPNDFSLGITFTFPREFYPGLTVVDGAGNVFAASCGTCNGNNSTLPDFIAGFSAQGDVISFITQNIHKPQGIALDKDSTYLWSTNLAAGGPNEINRTSVPLGINSAKFPIQTMYPSFGVAVDPSGNGYFTLQGLDATWAVTPNTDIYQTFSTDHGPTGIALDAAGYAYVADTTAGNVVSCRPLCLNASPSTLGASSSPIGVALDQSSNVFTLNADTGYLSVLSKTGNAITTGGGADIGATQASFIAVAGDGTAWIANSGTPNNLLHVTSTGAPVANNTNLQNPGFNLVGTTAIDPSGNVWVSNNVGGSLTQLLGVAAPVVTPLARAVATNQIGVRP